MTNLPPMTPLSLPHKCACGRLASGYHNRKWKCVLHAPAKLLINLRTRGQSHRRVVR